MRTRPRSLCGSAVLLAALHPVAMGQGGPPVAPDPLREIRPRLVSALDKLNLGPGELGFPKQRADSFSLAPVVAGLDDPLGLARRLSGYRLAAGGFAARPGPTAAARVVLSLAELPPFGGLVEVAAEAKTAPTALALLCECLGKPVPDDATRLALPGKLGEGMRDLMRAMASLGFGLTRGWGAPLAGEERARALAALPALWTEAPELRKGEVPAEGKGLYRSMLGDALRVDWSVLGSEALGALGLIEGAAGLFSEAGTADLPARVTVPGAEGDVRLWVDTPFGPIVLGGPGRTRYLQDLFVCVDLGGDDIYEGRVGAASFVLGRPASVCIDLGGDDHYRSKASLDQGAALFGCGYLLDLGRGEDRYEGSDLAQGAALLGFGLLYDDGGDDRYRARGLVQGAAAFGFGVLADAAGSEAYEGARYAQGFGGVRGFAAILDARGNDLYRAGELYLHAPLFDDRYQSLSQGFGLGLRYEDASGGIGLLWDGSGNDRYLADIYGQGAGYWMALGALIDEAGNDSYVCGQYGQGAGIHLACGGLWDLGGDDSYTLHHGVGQGGGHDLAVGFLLEGGGNDYYQGAGLTQGSAGANAVGICIDIAGDDAYAGAVVGGRVQHQGYGAAARGYGSIGLCLDLAGTDVFSHRLGDEPHWQRGRWGLSWDVGAAAPTTVGGTPPGAVEPVLPSPLPPAKPAVFEALWSKARLWQVGANRGVVANARATLVALGLPAGRWVIAQKLDAKQTLDLRALYAVATGIGVKLLPEIRAALTDIDAMRRRNALELVARLADKTSVDRVVRACTKDLDAGVRRKAALVLGRLGAPEGLAPLAELALSKAIEDRRTAASALRGIPGEPAIHRLADLLADPSFTVRDPARTSIAARRAEALEVGLGELGRAEGRALREWLRLFIEWKEPKARAPLEKLRDAEDNEVGKLATEALEALPPETGAKPGKEADSKAAGKRGAAQPK